MPVFVGLKMLAAYFCDSCYSQGEHNSSLIKVSLLDACISLSGWRCIGVLLQNVALLDGSPPPLCLILLNSANVFKQTDTQESAQDALQYGREIPSCQSLMHHLIKPAEVGEGGIHRNVRGPITLPPPRKDKVCNSAKPVETKYSKYTYTFTNSVHVFIALLMVTFCETTVYNRI